MSTPGTRLILAGLLIALTAEDTTCPSEPPADQTGPPSAPCDESRVIVRFVDPDPPSCLDDTTNYPPSPSSTLTVTRLHDCQTLDALAQWTEDPTLREHLSSTFVIQKGDGAALTDQDIQAILDAGYSRIEYDCPLAAMGTGDSVDRDSLREWTWGWHAIRTGAKDVVPAVLDQVAASGGATPVRVAVVDSGVELDIGSVLPDAGWSYETDAGVSGRPWLNDGLGHGTSIASLILETSGNLARIVSIKVLDAGGRGHESWLARGVLKATFDFGAVLVNLSLGYPQREGPEGVLPDFLSEPLAAIHARGARVFAAAGNNCGGVDPLADLFYPAASPYSIDGTVIGVVSVGGLNPFGNVSSQTVWESDISAPSEFICSRTSLTASATGYHRLSGSSFAVPQVVGAVALFAAKVGATSIEDLDEVVSLLLSSRDDYGRMNLCRAWDAVDTPLDPCISWDNSTFVDPAGQYCYETPTSTIETATYSTYLEGINEPGYVTSNGYDTSTEPTIAPADQGRDAVWCGGISSSPSSPLCTSCDYCFSADNTSYRLSLRLSAVAADYDSFQLRVKAGGAYYYYALGDLAGAAGNDLEYDGTFEPALPGPPEEAWLVARHRFFTSLWSGVPLMRVNTCL